MYIIFLTMLLIFMLLSQINTALRKKKSKDAVRTEKKQGKRYYRAMAWMWGPAIVVITISLIGGISLADLGLRGISFTYNIWFTAIVLVVSGLMLVVSLRTLILSLASKKFIEKMRTEIERDDVARDILPRTKKEKCQYIMLSFSSGICEELVYRGFMAFLLQAVFPEIPIFLIILITSVLFGIGHLYQGWQGVLQTGVVGAIFMSLLLVTNSL
ncbi:MAG: CPBP family intramembrane metalloprotease, partial [Defluviitaleaceae bacterium]|nr:CPBP family intramembrane metalloprotease [Defluviitaleaceae bacterium]MCL2240428.1 CPBP family intramembrane metalloprotease [Defluviitaleaceae bacterium]